MINYIPESDGIPLLSDLLLPQNKSIIGKLYIFLIRFYILLRITERLKM
jgi:hypothetical protein